MAWLIKGLAWLLLGIIALVVIWYVGFDLLFLFWGVALAGFAFYRSVKAFVEFWRSRISERVEIEISADRSTYLPGDTVNVTASVKGKQELDVLEGRVDLLYANRYIYRSYSSSSSSNGGGGHYTRHRVTDEVAVATERILEEGTILSGSYSGHEVTLEVPPAAPPSASGEITSVEWKVRVTLGIRGAPDVIEEVPVSVLSSIESYASWAESAPELDSAGVCDMGFRLPGRSFRTGERIEGTLVVTPRQDFEPRALRVDLVRREIVPRSAGNTSETVPASVVVEQSPRFQTGMSREYAFAVDVPEAAGPDLKTEQTYVGWWLRAVMDRELALDYELRQLLNVYNGPGTRTAEHCPNCGTQIPQGASFCTGCGEAVSREEAPRQTQQDAPSRTVPVGQTLPSPETAQQQPAFSPPQAPPSGGGRAQRGIVLGVFVAIGAMMLLFFLIFGFVVLIFVLAAL